MSGDLADARAKAEEALRRVLANAATIVRLSWSDGATPSDRANLERIKSAAADIAQDHKILRALLAAEPATERETLGPRECGGRCHDAVDSRTPCPECAAEMPAPPPPPAQGAVREAAERLRQAVHEYNDGCRVGDPYTMDCAVRLLIALDARGGGE